jgi:hypothetical protein
MVEQTPTRIVRQQGGDTQLATRIALFAVVMNAKAPPSLLEGLSVLHRADAEKALKAAKEWPSSQRQARLALEFGARGDQLERLQALVGEASSELRRALYVHMTPQQQARFAHLASKGTCTPAMESLAARLVREAAR